jgi:hypothetical protein
MGQRHMLAYINEDERRLLKDLGGADIPGPAGIPSFPPKAVAKAGGQSGSSTSTKTVSTPAGTKTVSTAPASSKTVEVKSTAALREEKAAKDAAATAAAQARVNEILSRQADDDDDRDDRAPAGTYVPSAPLPAQVTREPEPYSPPVIDLGVINIAPEADYSYDPFAESLQSQFDEMRSRPLETGTTLADLAIARVPSLAAEGVASLIGSIDPRDVGVTVSPMGEVDAFYQPRVPTAAERYLRDIAAGGRAREAQIFENMSPTLQQEVLAPIFTRQAGYDAGQVDPRLAAAAGLDPNELIFNPRALGTQAVLTAPSTLLPLGIAALNPLAGYGLGATMTVGEGSRAVSDAFDASFQRGEVQQSPLYQDMLARTGGDAAAALTAVKNQVMDTASPILAGLGAGSTAIARNITDVGGLVTRLLGVPVGRTGAALAGAGVEAGTEALEEGFLEKAAIAQPGLGLTGVNIYPTYEEMLSEGAVGALVGGGLGLGAGLTQATTPFVQTVAPSVSQPAPPFIPAAPVPGFVPGAGPAATMTVEGTATDVTPGFRPTGPSVGQVAQTPPGLLTAYQQAADTMREAGVRGVGGTPATMMDVAAATEIINNEISETGGLSPETALNLERATGLSATAIKDIAETAPRVGTARDTLITDVVTGTGGGGQIQVTSNPNGTYTLRNLTTGNPQHVATVEPGQSLDEAIKVFDEVTTVGSPEAIRVDTAGTATLPPAQLTREPAPYTSPAAEPTTALVPTRPTGIATLPSVGAGTQLDTAQPVDLTADSRTTSEILEFTPAEDFIEGTAVEIAGQIPGTVATQTTPTTPTAATTTATQTTPTTGIFTFAEEIEPPPEEPAAPEAEEEGPGAGAEEPGAEITIQEAVDEAAEDEEAPFECPEGYTAVKLAGRWVCQKTETSTVGRPTVGTRPYLSRVGFAGPSPYPSSTRTVTRTVTAAE